MVPDGHPHHAPLLKVFKHKIKRAKKKPANQDKNGVEDEDDIEEYDDEDDDDDDNDDDGSSDGPVDDTCPSGCDTTLYEQVLELREKRLDQEEILADVQRSIDDMRRTCDRHTQREKQIRRDVDSYTKEIRAFQTEKQQRLNKYVLIVKPVSSPLPGATADFSHPSLCK